MSQNIEIEFKNMLTKMEYEKILKELQIDKKLIFKQENHYFDTPDFALKEQGSALRIRKKAKSYELTLKQPATVGLLETNQLISEEEAINAIQSNKLPAGKIKAYIEEAGISFAELEYFGSLETKRVEFDYQNGLLVLDHSLYLNNEDYELEYEAENYQEGKERFSSILMQFNIPERITKNKIQRFYNQKMIQDRRTTDF